MMKKGIANRSTLSHLSNF